VATKVIPAGEFKQGCLAILDQVGKERFEVIITKRGRPLAKLVPIEAPEAREAELLARLRGRARGSIGKERDLLTPTSSLTRW
jgi:prevent-host-death family protein